jgi:4-hydroxy-tetrahydrodipicolinate synthase
VTAIKEAGGSAERVSAILDTCEISVLSGDDPLTLPMMAVGAVGVVSVASNVAPSAVAKMVRLALEGKWNEAMRIHRSHWRLFTDMFIDTNPIPVKTALCMMGLIEEVFRLPLCSMSDPLKERLAATLNRMGLMP